jgi:HEAT repeat protein
MASRALKAERSRDAGERFLIALSEPDRAVRAVLARRLRTLPIADVLEQAEVLLGEDAAGVVQILGELREPEVTRYLLALAERAELPALVRARAIGSIEADQPWERDELGKLAYRADLDDALRVAAVQALAAFATTEEIIERTAALAASPSAAIRGAVLWGLQLAARPNSGELAHVAAIVGPLLDDPDAAVRRRAAYVAGNLGLASLAPVLAKRCAASEEPAMRLAAYVALGELGMPGVLAEVAAAVKREDDPRVLGAASNALVAAMASGAAGEPRKDAAALAVLGPRAQQLLAAPDARVREAAAEIAGLLGGAVPAPAIVALVGDVSPAVRGAAVQALGQLGDPSTETALLAAFRDDDPAVHERAAAGLLRLGTPAALAQAIAFAAGDADATARAEVAAGLAIPRAHAESLAPAIDAALARITADDAAFEPLLRLKLASAARADKPAAPADVDAEIAAVFPAFTQMVRLPGFDTMIRSLRTAESLFQTTGGDAGADLSPPITLWMKVLENYVHAWLGPRMAGLQREPATLFEYVDQVIGASWPSYQRWLEPKWKDPIEVGGARVEVPLRAIPNAVRELQEHRRKRLDSPLSVTEWARLMVLFAIDHASGFKNMMRVGATGTKGDRTVSLAHRLHTLAAVRNLVTHRSAAGTATLAAFRKTYYGAFEELITLA